MIAYRTETVVVNIVRKYSHKKDEAKSIVCQMFKTDANVLPDNENDILKICINNMSTPPFKGGESKIYWIYRFVWIIFLA